MINSINSEQLLAQISLRLLALERAEHDCPENAMCLVWGMDFEVDDVGVLLTPYPTPPHDIVSRARGLIVAFYDRHGRRTLGYDEHEMNEFAVTAERLGRVIEQWDGQPRDRSASYVLDRRLPVLERAVMNFLASSTNGDAVDRGRRAFGEALSRNLAAVMTEAMMTTAGVVTAKEATTVS